MLIDSFLVHALGELAIMYPVSGSFYTYSARFIDPSWGFAMGWNYVLQWASVLPLELTVCGISIQYWNADISVGVWIAVFLVVIIIINVFGALGYAEEEFWASLFKLCAIVIFMIIALVLVCGGGPSSGRYDEYWGARYWHNPGAFKNGFKGFCSVFVTAAFSFSGTELVGLAAAESHNPVKTMPTAIKQVFWRITLFYILGLFFVGLLIEDTDPALLNAGAYNDPKASPFVLVGKYAGLTGFDHFMNLVILVSVMSISVSAVYGGSRTLTALAQQKYAPKIFTYIDKSGRPLFSVILIILFGFIAFVSLSATGPVVFTWLLSISGLATLFTWGSVCVAHIRFRKAWAYHGHTVDEIPFRAAGGVYGSWLGLFLCVIVLMAQVSCTSSPGHSVVFLKSPSTNARISSFTLRLRHRPESLAWRRPRPSSSSTSPLLSFSSSGPLATSGSARDGCEPHRSMLTQDVVNWTGTKLMPIEPRWPPCRHGDASSTRCSSLTCVVRGRLGGQLGRSAHLHTCP